MEGLERFVADLYREGVMAHAPDLLRLREEATTAVMPMFVYDSRLQERITDRPERERRGAALDTLGRLFETPSPWDGLEDRIEAAAGPPAACGVELLTQPFVINYTASSAAVAPTPGCNLWFAREDRAGAAERELDRLTTLSKRVLENVEPDLTHTEASVKNEVAYHLLFGRIAGIPECDRRRFAEGRRDRLRGFLDGRAETADPCEWRYVEPEPRAARRDFEAGVWDVLWEYLDGDRTVAGPVPESFLAHFASGIYPCTPGCGDARATGRAIYDGIADPRVRRLYHATTTVNVASGLVEEYQAWQRGDAVATAAFFEARSEAEDRTVEALERFAGTDHGRQIDTLLSEAEAEAEPTPDEDPGVERAIDG